MAGAELTGKLTIDASGFLGLLQRALDQGSAAINKWANTSGKVNAKVNVDTTGAKRSLDDLEKHAEKTGGILGKLGGLGGALGFAALATGVGSVAKAMISGNAEMEQYNTSFEVLTGGVENAKSLMGELKNFAQSTPFEFPQLAKASQTLLAFGVAQKDILPTLQKLGDVSGGNAEKLQSLALVFGQIQANGKLMGGDLLQLINAGFNPLKVMSEKTGKSVAQLRAEMEKGQISAQMVTDAFTAATSEGGQFNKMMEKQALTFEGLKSTLQDVGGELLRTLGGPVFTVAKETITQLLKIFQGPEVQAAIGQFGTLLGSLIGPVTQILVNLVGPLTTLLGSLSGTLVQVLTPIADVLAVLGSQVGSILGALATTVAQVLTPLGALITGIFTPLGDLITSILAPLGDIVVKAIAPLGAQLGELATVVTPVLNKVFIVLSDVLKGLLLPILQLVGKQVDFVGKIFTVVVGVLKTVLEQALPPLVDVFRVLVSVLNTVIGALSPIIEILGDVLKPILAIVTPILQQFGQIFATLLVAALRIVTPLLQLVAGVINALLPILVGSNDQWGLLTGLLKLLVPVLEGVLSVVSFVVEGIGGLLTTLTDFLGLTDEIERKAAALTKQRAESLSAAAKQIYDSALTFSKGMIQTARSAAEVDDALKGQIDRLQKLSAERQKSLPAEEAKPFVDAYAAAIVALQDFAAERKKTLAPIGSGSGTTTTAADKKQKQGELDLLKDLETIRDNAAEREQQRAVKAIEDQAAREREALRVKYDKQITDATEKQEDLFRKLKENAEKEKPDAITIGDEIVTRVEAERRIADAIKKQKEQIEADRLADARELEKKIAEDTLKRQQETQQKEIDALKRQEEAITATTVDALNKRLRLQLDRQAKERKLLKTEDEVASFNVKAATENANAVAQIELAKRREMVGELATIEEQQRELALIDLDTRLAEELARVDLTEQQKTEIIKRAEEERRDIRAKFLNDTSLVHRALNAVRSALESSFTATVSAEEQKRRKEAAASAESDLQALKEKQAAGLVSLADYNKQAAILQREIDANTTKSVLSFTDFTKKVGEQFTGFLSNIATKFGGTFDDTLDKFSKGNAKLSDLLLASAGTLGGVLTQAAAANENLLEATLKATGKLAFDFLMKMVPIWTAKALEVEFTRTGIIGAPLAIAGWLALTATLQGILAGIRGSLGFNKGTDSVPGTYRGRDSVPANLTPGEAVVQRDMNKKHGWLVKMIRRDDPQLAVAERAIRRGLREPTGERWSVAMNGKVFDRVNQAAAMASTAMVSAQQTRAELSAVSKALETTNAELALVRMNTGSTAKSTESTRQLIKFAPPKKRRIT